MKHTIVAVRKFHDGRIQSVKFKDGNVLDIDRAVDVAKAGLIDNVRVELDPTTGIEHLEPISPSGKHEKLQDFPVF
ncbi:hypothetical protein HNQ80_004392 [Anaerosolibacter carboniphilus]|uniref:DUF3892 domain-containing protein n=1 Tax=Anaerosolibacter carboniphilus TaxID=1417629 RepID=A0A841KY13_9FIRM|nr:DUF3892 domain-containing protein [Anaerosolibacter carboniphilus]MBB6218233.1 hypothetical protein [Anaerosolibacter carboniphilus]